MQSLMIGLGAVIASALPWMLTHWFGMADDTGDGGAIPRTVKFSFYVGAVAFLGAVTVTILTTKEYPPPDLEAFRRQQKERRGLGVAAKEILEAMAHMPSTMRQLAWVQVFTWLGLFCMWLYFPVAVARNVFGAPDQTSELYTEGVKWGGLCFAMYSAVTFLFSFVLAALSGGTSRKLIHTVCLLCGALGLLSVGLIRGPEYKLWLFASMTGVGIAWASILSMPYALLAGSLPPERTGVYMGIFNFFIVLPEIAAALGFGLVMKHLLGGNRLAAVLLGGVCLIIAALLVQRVKDVHPTEADN
jgi:maltose/moltooligosaccharide transporter